MTTFNSGAPLNRVCWGKTSQGMSFGQPSKPLSMEQKMLLGTLTSSCRAMSATELTNHWTPTWSLHEVTKFLDDLVKSGYVRTEGRHVKLYSASMAAISEKVGSQ